MYLIEAGNCNGCGACESICPEDAVRMVSGVPVIDQQRCRECGACFDACTQGAIYELREPARVATAPGPASTAVVVPETSEQGLGLRIPPATARTGVLMSAFPVMLKLAGALAEYVSARAGQVPGVKQGTAAGKTCSQAGGRGRHRHGRG